MAKKTSSKTKKPIKVALITADKLTADKPVFDAIVALLSIYANQPRRPAARAALCSILSASAIFLLSAQDDAATAVTMHLLDKDATDDGYGSPAVSQRVKPVKRKKAVRGR